MRTIVTGATGFLGGALCRVLLARGDSVIALGRSWDKLDALAKIGAETYSVDLAGPCPDVDFTADAMVHAAALSSPWGLRADFLAANVTGTETALEVARASRAERFVHISTPSLYFQFHDQLGVKEDHPLPPPVNAYAETKGMAETLAAAAHDLEPIILRPRGLYGKGDTSLLPRLIKAAEMRPLPLVNGGRAATDLTHVDDVVGAILAALDAPADMSQLVFNISGGAALNVRDVATKAAARAGVEARWRKVPTAMLMAYARTSEAIAKLRPGRPEPAITAYGAGLFAYTQTLDISAARQHLNWQPKISFEQGLAMTFEEEGS